MKFKASIVVEYEANAKHHTRKNKAEQEGEFIREWLHKAWPGGKVKIVSFDFKKRR